MSLYPVFARICWGCWFLWWVICFLTQRNLTSEVHGEGQQSKEVKTPALLMSLSHVTFLLPWFLLFSGGVAAGCILSALSSPLLGESPRCSYASRLSRQQRQQCVVVISLPRTELAFCVTVPPGEGRQTAARQGIPVTIRTVQAATSRLGQWHWLTEVGIHEKNAKMTVDFEECIKDSPRFR